MRYLPLLLVMLAPALHPTFVGAAETGTPKVYTADDLAKYHKNDADASRTESVGAPADSPAPAAEIARPRVAPQPSTAELQARLPLLQVKARELTRSLKTELDLEQAALINQELRLLTEQIKQSQQQLRDAEKAQPLPRREELPQN